MLEQIINYCRIDASLATSGQPSAAQFQEIANAGFETIVNLALTTSSNAIENEAGVVAAAGMDYVHIPVSWEAPQASDVEQFFETMQSLAGKPVWVHCALNMRVSCFVYLYRNIILGVAEDEARAPMDRIWQPEGNWAELIRRVQQRREGS